MVMIILWMMEMSTISTLIEIMWKILAMTPSWYAKAGWG